MSILKYYHAKFKQGPSWCERAEWETVIKDIMNTNIVRLDMEKREIIVKYDPIKRRKDDIEKSLAVAGFILIR